MGFFHQLNQWDQQFFLFLNGFHSTFFDYVMTVFTSEGFWVPLYLITGLVIIKKEGKNAIPVILSMGLLILCSDQFAGIFKHSVQRLRPSHDPEMSTFVHIFNNYKGGLYSFYSAHASNAFAYATFTMLIFRNRIYSLFIVPWALLVPYTRIYLGLHYPGDILSGAIAGVIIAFGVYRLMILTGEKFYPVLKFSASPARNHETGTIVITGIVMIVLTLMIVHLFISRQLILIS